MSGDAWGTRPADTHPASAGPGDGHRIVSLGDTGGAGKALVGFGLLLVLLGAVVGYAIVIAEDEVAGWVVAATLAVPGLILLALSRRSLAIGRRFEPGVLEAATQSFLLGATVHGRFRRPVKRGSTDITRIEARLLLQEWVRWRQGTDTRTATRDIHTYPVDVRHVNDPLAVTADVTLRLPTYPPSFKSSNNEVRWHLIVDVEMADGFAEDSILPLWVVPAMHHPPQQPVDRR